MWFLWIGSRRSAHTVDYNGTKFTGDLFFDVVMLVGLLSLSDCLLLHHIVFNESAYTWHVTTLYENCKAAIISSLLGVAWSRWFLESVIHCSRSVFPRVHYFHQVFYFWCLIAWCLIALNTDRYFRVVIIYIFFKFIYLFFVSRLIIFIINFSIH